MRFKVIQMSEFCAGNCRFELSQEVNKHLLCQILRCVWCIQAVKPSWLLMFI